MLVNHFNDKPPQTDDDLASGVIHPCASRFVVLPPIFQAIVFETFRPGLKRWNGLSGGVTIQEERRRKNNLEVTAGEVSRRDKLACFVVQ